MNIPQLLQEKDFCEALKLPEALFYKHSPMCWSSSVASRHVARFAADHPNCPVFFVDVVANRSLSQFMAAELDVRHESPQVIATQNGSPVWHASHYRITRGSLKKNLLSRKAAS